MRTILRSLLPLAAIAAAGCDTDYSSVGPGGGDAALEQLASRDFAQMERMGLPAIATVFIPSTEKDNYNQSAPADDRAKFLSFVVAKLIAFGHPDPNGLAAALQPDVLPLDLTRPSGFLNGRRLPDDVITAELGLIFGSNAALNDDHVDANDKAFLADFPYLAAPGTP